MTYKIILEPRANQDLLNIISYITKKDSRHKANDFARELKESIISLSEMPMRCRKSFYLERGNTRDLIHKGYTIVFQVREDRVHILTIFRQMAF